MTSPERNLKNVNIPSDPESIDDHVEEEMSPEDKEKRVLENTWPRKRFPSDSDIDEEPHEEYKIKDPIDIDAECDEEGSHSRFSNLKQSNSQSQKSS